MEGRGVIAKLLLLAQEPSNQTFIARDEGCMSGLVASLLNIDPEIVLIASRTLQFLSGHPQNKRLMKDFPQLVENLLQAAAATNNNKTREFCTEALDNLGVRTTQPQDLDDSMEAAQENISPNKQQITPATYSKFNIFVDDLDDASCILAQRVLIKIPGVISVSFEMDRGTASIGTREKDVEALKEKLLAALRNAGLSGRLKPRDNEENENDVNETSKLYHSALSDENSGYLEESDYSGDKENAMTRWGPSSLEARLEQERREEELRSLQTGRILSKVSSALNTVSSWLSGW